jgi:hypothetical protein
VGTEQQRPSYNLKDYLTKLTTLVKQLTTQCMLYLAASPVVVSAVLVEEKEYENKMHQFLIYFRLRGTIRSKVKLFQNSRR